MYTIDRKKTKRITEEKKNLVDVYPFACHLFFSFYIYKHEEKVSIENTPSRIMIDSGKKNIICKDNQEEDHRKWEYRSVTDDKKNL